MYKGFVGCESWDSLAFSTIPHILKPFSSTLEGKFLMRKTAEFCGMRGAMGLNFIVSFGIYYDGCSLFCRFVCC